MVGCTALSNSGGQGDNRLAQARSLLESGELYRARKAAEEVLKRKPTHGDAQQLMARIIDREIARHKEIFQTKTIEEFTPEEKDSEVRTWLERARALSAAGQYEEAILAAEKVFLYDPENQEASGVLDEIKQSAGKQGQKENLLVDAIREGEIQGRLERYRQQARTWVAQGKWGAARLAVEKILLLEPEDPEALKLHQKILSRQPDKAA